MTINKIEWIEKYLQGKVARLVDLKDFFTIQNDENRIKVKEISENEFSYTLKDCVFTVAVEPVEKPKSHVLVKEVACIPAN